MTGGEIWRVGLSYAGGEIAGGAALPNTKIIAGAVEGILMALFEITPAGWVVTLIVVAAVDGAAIAGSYGGDWAGKKIGKSLGEIIYKSGIPKNFNSHINNFINHDPVISARYPTMKKAWSTNG